MKEPFVSLKKGLVFIINELEVTNHDMTRFASGTKLPIVGKMKVCTMTKAVEEYMRLGNNIQIIFIFDKCEVVHGGKKPLNCIYKIIREVEENLRN